MMRKLFVATLAMLSFTSAFAQKDAEPKFRRSSLYTLKLDIPKDKDEYKEALKLMDATYDTLSIPNAYNDFNMATRHIDYTKLGDVTQEEMDLYKKGGKGGGFAKFAKGAASMAASTVGANVNLNTTTEEEYVAKLMNWFKADNTANKLVAKWHNKKGADPAKVDWDENLTLLGELGLVGLSEEQKEELKEAGNSLVTAAKDNEVETVGNSYVVVNRFGFLSGKELFEELSAPIVAQLASANPMVAMGLNKTLDIMKKKYATGYFVRAYAYLFQLQYEDAECKDFYAEGEGPWHKPANFKDGKYTLKYIGKSQGRARARKADDGNVISVAVRRAMDKCYADLQHDNEQFRPLAALHATDDGTGLYAYVGTKEGVTEKSVFDVFQAQMEGEKIVYKKVGSLKVQKGQVWDNRAGAGQADMEEEADEEDKDAVKGNASLKYTLFQGKPNNKINEGSFIKLAK